MKLKILAFFILQFSLTFSQITLNGIVKSQSDTPLEYVNIGIKHQNIGTISSDKGYFSITVDSSKINETLSFSYLGFQEESLKIKDLLNSKFIEIILTEKTNELKEVVVIASKPRIAKLGTQSYVTMVAGYVKANNDQNNDIQELAKEIKTNKPSLILDLNIHLFNVNIDSASFRINIYDIKDNLPNEKINSKNIIVQKKIENGWNKFELEAFDLTFDAPIFISIEYLPNQKDEKEPFRYSGQLLGKSITRASSLGTWNVKKGLTMSMYITVKQ